MSKCRIIPDAVFWLRSGLFAGHSARGNIRRAIGVRRRLVRELCRAKPAVNSAAVCEPAGQRCAGLQESWTNHRDLTRRCQHDNAAWMTLARLRIPLDSCACGRAAQPTTDHARSKEVLSLPWNRLGKRTHAFSKSIPTFVPAERSLIPEPLLR